MPASTPPHSPSLSRELVALAREIEASGVLQPEAGKRLFAVENPADGEPVAVSIPGEREEVAGVHFYAGARGIDFLVHLRNDFFGEDAGRDAMMALQTWAVDFEEFRFLEPEDLALLRLAGETPEAGAGRPWPVFRCASPGELPWMCGTEATRLRDLLRRCRDALRAAEAAPDLIAWEYLGLDVGGAEGDRRGTFLDEEITTDKVVDFFHENAMELDFAVGRKLHEDTIAQFPIWREVEGVGAFQREDFDLQSLPPRAIEFAEATTATLSALMNEPADGRWEIGRRLGVPVGEPHGRYHHTEILAIRSIDSGTVLAAELGKVSERPRLLGRMLQRVIFEADRLPQSIRSDDEELLVLLDLFGEEFAVAIEGRECPELDQELDLLVQRLLGS